MADWNPRPGNPGVWGTAAGGNGRPSQPPPKDPYTPWNPTGLPGPSNPLYSSYLDFAPTFNWGGYSWGANDQGSFKRWLASRGQSYAKWAAKNPKQARAFSSIDQQIYGAFQPQLAGIERERQAQRDYYQRLMQNLGGFTAAVGPLLSGIPQDIRNTYGMGANTMTAGGSGYGHQLNSDQAANAGAINSTLGAIDSPAQVQGGDAGSVLAGVAGWLPSEMMNAQGGAWGTRAENFPVEAGLQANLMMKDLLRQAADSDKEFGGKITDVLSGLPSARAELFQNEQSMKFKEQDAKLDALKSERDWYLKQQALALAQGKYQLAAQAGARAEDAQTRYNNASRGLDVDGNPKPGYRWGQNGLVEKIPTAKKGSTAKAPDWGKLQKDLSKDAAKFFDEVANPDDILGGKVKQAWKYDKAFKALWSRYSGMVKNKGRLRKLINEILAAQGIKKKKATTSGPPPDYQR